MAQKVHFSLRMDASTLKRLEKQAARRQIAKTRLAETYLDEAVRMAEHPGIGFRDETAGRRACVAGSRLDVWMIIETVRAEGGDIGAAADYFKIGRHLIQAAVDYYADYPGEIEDWIKTNADLAEESEAAARRSEAAIRT